MEMMSTITRKGLVNLFVARYFMSSAVYSVNLFVQISSNRYGNENHNSKCCFLRHAIDSRTHVFMGLFQNKAFSFLTPKGEMYTFHDGSCQNACFQSHQLESTEKLVLQKQRIV